MSVLAFYEMLASGEPSSTTISAAASSENSAQVFKELAFAIEHSPFKSFAEIVRYQKKVNVKSINSSFSSISSDGKRQHGTNANLVIIDEGHTVPRDLYDALRWAIAARENALLVIISTAGSDQNHWYYTQAYQKSKRVLKGEDLDISHYAQVHEADQNGDPESPEQWKKANPLLGEKWADADQFARDYESAKAGGLGEFLTWKRLRLNLWCRPDELCWLELGDWQDHKADFTEDELRSCEAAIGYDGSETTDPSSCTICHRLPGDRFYFRSWAWVAEDGVRMREAVNLPRYEQFREEGSMTITDGNLMDYKAIRDHVVNLCRTYNVRVFNFDPRSALVLSHEIKEKGYETEIVNPSFIQYNGPMKEFERAYKEGRILHDGSTWLKYCLSNVRVEVSRYDEIRPVRARSIDKIDCAISALLAFQGVVTRPSYQPSILW